MRKTKSLISSITLGFEGSFIISHTSSKLSRYIFLLLVLHAFVCILISRPMFMVYEHESLIFFCLYFCKLSVRSGWRVCISLLFLNLVESMDLYFARNHGHCSFTITSVNLASFSCFLGLEWTWSLWKFLRTHWAEVWALPKPQLHLHWILG